MNVVVALDQRYLRTPDGAVWTQATHAYSHFERYLDPFDGVKVVARVREVSDAPADWIRADGPGVRVVPVPYYLGPAQYAARHRSVAAAVRRAVAPKDAVILRVPATIGQVLGRQLRRQGRPFGVEVVADPYDLFGPGTMGHPLRPLFRRTYTAALRGLCHTAVACTYVTEQALQRRYPPGPGAFSTYYSSVILDDNQFRSAPQQANAFRPPLNLVNVANMTTRYKGTDVLIEAFARVCRELDARLKLIGDGRLRPRFEAQARRLGVADRVDFLGQLTCGTQVLDQLDQSEVFVLPSRQEGLPRALVEACARALPCIASCVGGIPEVISEVALVPPGDATALTGKIMEFAADPELMERESARNLGRAQDFREARLCRRRREFLDFLRTATQSAVSRSAQSDGPATLEPRRAAA